MNINSSVDAKGWAGLFNSFRSKDSKSPPVEWTELLPFPLDDGASPDRRKVSKETAEIYLRLASNGAVPVHVMGAFTELQQEMEHLVR